MKTARLFFVAALAAALPFTAYTQHETGPGKPPVVNLKPPPDSATARPAQDKAPGPAHKGHEGMDANKDGKLSRDEFVRHHEEMYDRMKKGPDGQVNMKEMHSHGKPGR
ncbi:MAG: hypothetical protein H0W40_03050 [Methylibium sp.]|uniref:hypothetical protein n=1 Tax=Methylibium sp. TaxID=2067992 RepID=UPI0017DEA33B|nr:hypothetical protein [Methylibium sp.]MBA3596340.1 hypothetical protein [Methylibium sp.]